MSWARHHSISPITWVSKTTWIANHSTIENHWNLNFEQWYLSIVWRTKGINIFSHPWSSTVRPWKMMVGILLSYLGPGNVSGANCSTSGGVHIRWQASSWSFSNLRWCKRQSLRRSFELVPRFPWHKRNSLPKSYLLKKSEVTIIWPNCFFVNGQVWDLFQKNCQTT